MNGYGKFVWTAFMFSFVSCFYLYLKIRYELRQLEKAFLLGLGEKSPRRIEFNTRKKTTEEILSIIEQECRFFESVIDDVKPDFLVISLTWQHQGELLRQMCKAKGIKILMFNTSELGWGSRWTISEEFGEKDFKTDLEIDDLSLEKIYHIYKKDFDLFNYKIV